jgi:hypothetical protein
MPGSSETNRTISVDFGAIGGDKTGVTVVTNAGTATRSQWSEPITLDSVMKSLRQTPAVFWKSLLKTSLGYPSAKEIRVPVQNQYLGGYNAWSNLVYPQTQTLNVSKEDIYYNYYSTNILTSAVNQQIQMNYQISTAGMLGNVIYTSGYDETPEERRIRKVREADREQKRKDAERRAEDLLITMLSDEQIIQYQKHGYFETDVKGKIYRIKKGRSGNVELIENSKPKFRYCAHPVSMTPDQDVMLSQFLMLHSDEQKFLTTANRTILNQ